MSEDRFQTLAASGEVETRIRGSTFLALAAPARTEAEARRVLEDRSRAMHDATHHCSAWRLREGLWRANDAGEPSGSAGAPILAAIDGAGLVDCMVVVTRYFGGTKLGVGGLVRAYGEAAQEALALAPRRTGVPALRLRVSYAYAHTSAVMRALERVGAEEVDHGFSGGGAEGEALFSIPAGALDAVRNFLQEQTGGAVAPEPVAEKVLYRAPAGGEGTAP